MDEECCDCRLLWCTSSSCSCHFDGINVSWDGLLVGIILTNDYTNNKEWYGLFCLMLLSTLDNYEGCKSILKETGIGYSSHEGIFSTCF